MKVFDLDGKFFQYHKENPHVYILFLKYTKQVKDKGFKHYSMETIMHRVRWHVSVETKDRDGYKMNNNYSSRYARLLVQEFPEFDGFFRNRKLQTYSILESNNEQEGVSNWQSQNQVKKPSLSCTETK